MKRIILVFASMVLGFVLSACSTPPTEEMNRAHDAVIRAESDADAVAYAPNALVRARQALESMQSEADAKRFDAARNFAAEAISHAERAIADGRSGAQRTRDEATSLINSLSGAPAETTTAFDNARQIPGLIPDIESLSRDLDAARRLLEEARQSLAAGNYREALSRAESMRSLLSVINTRLSEAVQAASRK